MKNRYQFRHRGHLYPRCHQNPEGTCRKHQQNQPSQTADLLTEKGCQNGNPHTNDSVNVPFSCRFLVRKPTQAEDEQNSGNKVGNGNDSFRHGDFSGYKMNKVELVFGEWDFLLTFRNHLDRKIQMRLRLSCMIICETFPTSCG